MKKGYVGGILCFAILVFAFSFIGNLSSDVKMQEEVSRDTNMETEGFYTEIQIGEDHSYQIQETIDVDMRKSRHGIYRYVPVKGTVYSKSGEKEIPYKAKAELISCNTPVSTEYSNGFFVMQLGDEDQTVTGPVTYQLKYRLTPMFQEKDGSYEYGYINVFPTSWQNEIPAGSSFLITFPKDIDKNTVHFYYGKYGSVSESDDVIETKWNQNQVKGTLLRDLSLGEGVTAYADVGEGYFTSFHRIPPVGLVLEVISLLILGITGLCFFILGRDEKIIPSVQFMPPVDLDSAAVGYIIDGIVENKDIISLILYWADRGHLTIQQDGKKKITLIKTGLPLPEDAPGYEKLFFEKLFRKGDQVRIKDLKYKCAKTIETSKSQVKDYVAAKGGLYTTSSVVARVVCTILSMIPMPLFFIVHGAYNKLGAGSVVIGVLQLLFIGSGLLLLEYGVDSWHGSSSKARSFVASMGMALAFAGIFIAIQNYWRLYQRGKVFDFMVPLLFCAGGTALCVPLCAFMKKRTLVCTQWMGRLLGLRDFIETAELDRLKVLAEENPQWFYHVLPYTYVFGLSDVFAKRLEPLAIPAPDWYVSSSKDFHSWNYYYFNRAMMSSMSTMTTTLTMVDVSAASGSGGSGGSFSSGSGGFSGGGFGGGGGGSW